MRSLALAIAAMLFAALGLVASAGRPGDDPLLVTIATGSDTGVYYLVAGALCGHVNERRWRHGVRCAVEESDGSIANLRALRSRETDFAIVQSDLLQQAYDGSGPFEAVGRDMGLRSIAPFYAEPVTVLARPNSSIAAFADLKGKRVNIGPPGSGGRATANALMQSMGWSQSDFALLGDFGAAALPDALCAAEIDAAVMVIAHPNRAVEATLLACETRLVPVGLGNSQPAERPAPYAAHVIPSTSYPGLSASVDTIAVVATLATTSSATQRATALMAEAAAGATFRGRLDDLVSSKPDTIDLLSSMISVPRHIGARAR